jgi:MFS family permease
LFLLDRFLSPDKFGLGYKWTLVAGAGSWLVLYILYILPRPRIVIVLSQAFHGLAYVFFIIAGQTYAGAVAPEGTAGSMQALIFTAQSGLGLFLGTQLAGVVMDMCRSGEKFRWRLIWLVPGLIMAGCVAALVLFYEGAVPLQ